MKQNLFCYKCHEIKEHDELMQTTPGNTARPSRFAACQTCGYIKNIGVFGPFMLITERQKLARADRFRIAGKLGKTATRWS